MKQPETNQKIRDEQENRQETNWSIYPYLSIALAIFLVFCACLCVVYVFFKFSAIKGMVGAIVSISAPILYGVAIGYMVNPIMKWFEKKIQGLIKKEKDRIRYQKLIRTVSSILAVLVFILIIVLLLYLMIPQVIDSVSKLIVTFPEQANSMIVHMRDWQFGDTKLSEQVEKLLTEGVDYLQKWTEGSLLPKIQTYVVSITSGVFSVLNVLKNLIIGLIVAIYVLCEKEVFEGQTKKIIFAFFKPRHANEIIQVLHTSNEIFGGFIKGKLLDSLIIGIICYIVLTFINMPYTALVSVIVGVTNIIPFFGPFIGAIPSALLILVANPIKALYFIIFIIILQQIDGNIIGPKILGNSTGLSSFWVMFAILIGSGMFGFMGMLFGCPVFAVIYYMAEKIVHRRLYKKKMPLETENYVNATGVETDYGSLRYEKYVDDIELEMMQKQGGSSGKA